MRRIDQMHRKKAQNRVKLQTYDAISKHVVS